MTVFAAVSEPAAAPALSHSIPPTLLTRADSEEKHEPVSDVDTAAAESLKALDPERPIGEADIGRDQHLKPVVCHFTLAARS
jgi:hypothetical protein